MRQRASSETDFFFFLSFSQISAGEPDPLGDQEVFLRPGRAAAPVSRPRVSLIVSKSPSCKLSRVNHTETQRLFVRAVHPNYLLPFLRFDVESGKKTPPLVSLHVCQTISITEASEGSCVCVCVCLCVDAYVCECATAAFDSN